MSITRTRATAFAVALATLGLVVTIGHRAEAGAPPEPVAKGAPLPPPTVEEVWAIDLAICLDTSGSMENLIESTKQHIWSIVNELALAKPQPRLRVALLTFGNDGHDEAAGWVRIDTDLTEDLDLVSERLFALTTNGGTELVGRVLKRAHDDLTWAPQKGALKLVVVAGNESADQDKEVPYVDACAALVGRDVLVNSLYCGGAGDAEASGWNRVARSADGRYFAIDTSGAPAYVESPFDEQLMALSADLNDTYLPMGTSGRRAWANQATQDANARGMNGANGASRAQSKANGLYFCGWDLVDVMKREKEFDLAKVDAKDLPEAMRDMTAKERRAHVIAMGAQREKIQAEVNDVSKKRAAYVARESAKLAADGQQSFETALLSAFRDQAGAKGFRFVE